MTAELLLGVDVGTSSTKGVLASTDGRVIATHVVPHALDVPRPGWAEHDAERAWWGGFVEVVRALLRDVPAESVRALAVSGIGPCVVPADADGRPLRPAILYGIDVRAGAEIEELEATLGREQILGLGGNVLTSQSVGPKLLWLRRHEPEVWAATRLLLPASSFLVHRLTGEYVTDQHTAGGFSPLYDLGAGAWDPPSCLAVLGDDDPALPRLAWTDEVVGTVHAPAASETGLAVGTPVTAGTVDAVAEAWSVGVRAPGDLMLMYGSTMFLLLVSPGPSPDARLWTTPYVQAGSLAVTGGMATSGLLTAWLRDLATTNGHAPSFDELLAEAAAVPAGAEGLLALPYFSGERTPLHDPRARGVLAGLTLRHRRGHVYRALLEATALAVRHHLEVFDEVGARTRRIVAVGGGAAGELWPQIVSDACGIAQEVPLITVGASYGDALLAGMASGLVGDPGSWNPVARRLVPDETHADLYDRLYAAYRALYPATRSVVHDLADLADGASS